MAKRFKPPQTRVVDICIDDETHEWSTLVLPLNCTPRDVLNKLKERHISVKNKAVASKEQELDLLEPIPGGRYLWLVDEEVEEKPAKTLKATYNPPKKRDNPFTSSSLPTQKRHNIESAKGATLSPAEKRHGNKEFEMSDILKELKKIAKKQEEVEVEIKQIKATCNDILQRIETTKGNRDIDQYKGNINRAVAKVYCKSLFREVKEKDMTNIITEVLGDDNDVGKFEEAMGFARLTVSTFRTEERRKLLGKSPYGEYYSFSNVEFVKRLMKTMKADLEPAVMRSYEKNIALIRKFINEESETASVRGELFSSFKTWTNFTYPRGVPEEDWDNILNNP